MTYQQKIMETKEMDVVYEEVKSPIDYLKKNPLVIMLLNGVKKEMGTEFSVLNNKSHKRNLVEARQIVMFLLQKHTNYSKTLIAKLFQKKTHATTIHATKTIEKLYFVDKRIEKTVDTLENLVLDYKTKLFSQNEDREDVFINLLEKYVLNEDDIKYWKKRFKNGQ